MKRHGWPCHCQLDAEEASAGRALLVPGAQQNLRPSRRSRGPWVLYFSGGERGFEVKKLRPLDWIVLVASIANAALFPVFLALGWVAWPNLVGLAGGAIYGASRWAEEGL